MGGSTRGGGGDPGGSGGTTGICRGSSKISVQMAQSILSSIGWFGSYSSISIPLKFRTVEGNFFLSLFSIQRIILSGETVWLEIEFKTKGNVLKRFG